MSGSPWRIVIPAPGDPEVLTREDFTPPAPGPGELLVRNEAVGVNFLDTYFRSGLYPRSYPCGLGNESAGVIEAVGPGVEGFAVGDRIACLADGAYATHVIAPADRSFRMPDSMEMEDAAAILLKGLTAWMLTEGVRPVTPGTRVLVLAAAGGVGSLLVPWLRALGATVIAHAGSA
jgi:NADPH2:quinone reductase